ncbi:hypothetical protein JOM56_009246 [Amanita muscaria]
MQDKARNSQRTRSGRGKYHRERSISPAPKRELSYKRRRGSSPSPPKDHKHRSASPHEYRANKRSRGNSDFQQGADGRRARSACTICLGRKGHDPKKCFSKTLWDDSKAHYKDRQF